jgi:hypothetical protein
MYRSSNGYAKAVLAGALERYEKSVYYAKKNAERRIYAVIANGAKRGKSGDYIKGLLSQIYSLYFPEYKQVFGSWECESSLIVLQNASNGGQYRQKACAFWRKRRSDGATRLSRVFQRGSEFSAVRDATRWRNERRRCGALGN